MKRKLLIVLLGFGAIAGYAGGCVSMHHHGFQRRAAFEQHVADVCVAAAHRVHDTRKDEPAE